MPILPVVLMILIFGSNIGTDFLNIWFHIGIEIFSTWINVPTTCFQAKTPTFQLIQVTRHDPASSRCHPNFSICGIGNDNTRSQLIWFSLNLGRPRKHFWLFHLRLYAVFTPLTIEWWIGSAVSSEQTSCGEEERSATRGLKVRQSLPSERCSWLFSAIVIYFGTQPAPAETHYLHCHVFRLTVWNTRGGHTRIEHYKSQHVRDKLSPRRQRAEFVSFRWATLCLIINAGLFPFFCLSAGTQNKSVNSNDLSAFQLVESGSPALVRPMWQNWSNSRARLRGLIKSFHKLSSVPFFLSFFPLQGPAGLKGGEGPQGPPGPVVSFLLSESQNVKKRKCSFPLCIELVFLSSPVFDLCHRLLRSLQQCISCFTEGCVCQAPAGRGCRGSVKIASIYRS